MSNKSNTTVIFENYEGFVKDHQDDLGTPTGVVKLLQDRGMFSAFRESLTEGLNDDARSVVSSILDRQRECVLEESANVPSSTFTH
jgi:hypothetical protein